MNNTININTIKRAGYTLSAKKAIVANQRECPHSNCDDDGKCFRCGKSALENGIKSNELIKNFQPVFGNENHRIIAAGIGRLNLLETRDIKTKSNLEEIDRLRKDIIWRVNKQD